MNGQIYRQGDVLLQRIDTTVPKKAELTDWTKEGRIILAYGEVTGHAHAIALDYAKMYRWEGDRLLAVGEKGAELTHEEHGTIALAPGVYKVIQQREYTPQAIRNVAD